MKAFLAFQTPSFFWPLGWSVIDRTLACTAEIPDRLLRMVLGSATGYRDSFLFGN